MGIPVKHGELVAQTPFLQEHLQDSRAKATEVTE